MRLFLHAESIEKFIWRQIIGHTIDFLEHQANDQFWDFTKKQLALNSGAGQPKYSVQINNGFYPAIADAFKKADSGHSIF